LNLYTYVNNAPHFSIDPLGLDPQVAIAWHEVFVGPIDTGQVHANVIVTEGGKITQIFDGQGKDGLGFTHIGGQLVLLSFDKSNRPMSISDYKSVFGNLRSIQPVDPGKQTPQSFVRNLKAEALNYGLVSPETYDPAGSGTSGFNSNQLASGLIQKAGGTLPTSPKNAPGFTNPLPIKTLLAGGGDDGGGDGPAPK
jgi:hypothetical protein